MTKKKVVKLSSTRVDLRREREGEWIASKTFEGVSYHVRSTNSPDYVSAQQKQMRSLQAKIRDKRELDQDEMHAEEANIVVDCILLGWNGFDQDYTADLALEELRNPQSRPLLNDIIECASRVGRNELETIEVDVKN